MLARTHLLFAFLLVLFIAPFSSNPLLFAIIALLFSLIPDIDEPKSKLGRKIWPLSSFFKLFFGHRKILHSFFIPVLLFLLILPLSFLIATAVFLGYISHLFTDMLTKEGIIPFYPIPFRLHGFITTGGFSEKIFYILTFIIILYKLFVEIRLLL